MKRPQSLDKVLSSSSSQLADLVTHARYLRRLQFVFNRSASPAVSKHCQIANYQNGHLLINCDSAAWTTRISLEKSGLMLHLQQNPLFQGLLDIQVVTRPNSQLIDNKENTKPIEMSRETADMISQVADSVSDPKLQEALRKLSRHRSEK